MNILQFKRVVPKDRLVHVVESEKIECSKEMDAMFESLVEQRLAVASSVFDEYKYAGSTAVNIFEAINFPSQLNNMASFITQLKSYLRIDTQIVGIEFRPQIQETPQINLIEEISDNSLLIQWVSGRKRPELDGYGIVERLVPKLETMIIRFGSPVFVELRSSYNQRNTYLGLLASLLSQDEHSTGLNIEWVPITKVTEDEAEQIAAKLKAGLLESEHLGEGCIGKYGFTAAPGIENLKDQKQFQDFITGKPYLAQVFHVDYVEAETGYTTKVKFKINHKGGFEFKSKVSERIIKRILDVFVEVRYHKVASGE
ncbi:hypothetical protein [Paenibacillus sp. SI8]|uniref:hypothetical protein n=1 Tax=unclassified Paenibacillus TaxID=185978 RepID=UPI0034662026